MNMSASSVCGVAICERAGKWSAAAAATGDQPLAVARRDPESGQRLERVAQALAVVVALGGRLEHRSDQPLGLAHRDDVAKRGEGNRVGEGERTAGDDQRVAGAAVIGERRDPGALETLDQPGDLELVGHRKREQRIVANRSARLESGERIAGLREHRAVGGEPRHLVDPPVDVSGSRGDDIAARYGLG